MARVRQHMHYSDTRAELADYKDAYRGAIEDAFWDEDELVDYRPSSKRKRPKKKKGCEGNDGKAHVYVWVPYVSSWTGEVWKGYEQRICCGCMKKAPRGFRRAPR